MDSNNHSMRWLWAQIREKRILFEYLQSWWENWRQQCYMLQAWTCWQSISWVPVLDHPMLFPTTNIVLDPGVNILTFSLSLSTYLNGRKQITIVRRRNLFQDLIHKWLLSSTIHRVFSCDHAIHHSTLGTINGRGLNLHLYINMSLSSAHDPRYSYIRAFTSPLANWSMTILACATALYASGDW